VKNEKLKLTILKSIKMHEILGKIKYMNKIGSKSAHMCNRILMWKFIHKNLNIFIRIILKLTFKLFLI
jgi:hypothetical protein